MTYMLQNVQVKDNILQDEKYLYLFSVDAVNNQVLAGVPFREAYKNVGSTIADGTFTAPEKVTHSHEGSIGNLGNDQIQSMMERVIAGFQFEAVDQAITKLLA